MSAAAALLADQRRYFDSGATRPAGWRRTQLEALRRLLTEREDELTGAVGEDLGKSRTEAFLSEITAVRAEIDYALKHLDRWMAPERIAVPGGLQPGRAWSQARPLGVVLIIGPWNYPLNLVLTPLVGALAAGNAAVLKPSELAAATSRVLARLVPEYLDREAVAVVEGGAEVSTDLLAQPFDHVFYTGGERVGKIVMKAAAEHLTPVTLELGGKSPAVVVGGDLRAAARRIAYGKFMNAAQTCVAPDYVLTTPAAAPILADALAAAVRDFYGSDPRTSRDYGRIINEHHFDRLVGLMDGGTVVSGGRHERAERYIEPTVLRHVDPGSPLMQEEIFGPLLPILEVADLDEAIRFIGARPHPLAAYLFSDRDEHLRTFTDRVHAGGLAHNVCTIQLAVPGLPFGGVGASGTGSYHGRQSFETFSHVQPVFSKPTRVDTLRLAYPPFGPIKRRLLRRLL
ncbi:aldehyde dehydrogenase family protein [Arthrobacter burdickii]|jgi:aldehyde dehydrogenase (NAD+)|uniref:Aldehyde dehydrogenase n=1 Tax=Arthrobacter burdickii TaxID=3035920 RepID=A0ABT8JX23_9MICC|nr:aldehyde dehydrogenase family protein [Arthrobacter burdickii]MDN4609728.1 aldehyde dehydrogenase family protein [Arthrobacter burdickii]